MAIWLAAGDETGAWDIVDGRFCDDDRGTPRPSRFNGLSWVLGNLATWEKALASTIGSTTALEAFSQPIAQRLPPGVSLAQNSDKYHLLDVWMSFRGQGRDIPLDEPQQEPALELVRQDAVWLLSSSGLGVLAAGGNADDARAAGLGLSNDGLRERARAFAALLVPALPFLPGGDSLNLLVEGRTETALADAVRIGKGSAPAQQRYAEPYRDFLGRLSEDIQRQIGRCNSLVEDGQVIDEVHCKDGKGLAAFLEKLRGAPLLQANPVKVISAMKGIADLACTLAPRPEGPGFRLVVPDGFCSSLWAANYRKLSHAIRY